MGFESVSQLNPEKTALETPEARAGKRPQVLKEDSNEDIGFEVYAKKNKKPRLAERAGVEIKEKESNIISIFNRAIRERNIWKSFLSLKQVFHTKGEKLYNDFKYDFLNLIDYFLAQEDAEIVKKYKLDLELLKEFVTQDKYDSLPTETDYLEQLSEFGQSAYVQESSERFETAQSEVVINVFEGSIKEGPAQNPYTAYLQVIKAKELDLPEFTDMKARFLAFIEEEIAKDSKDLVTAAKVHLVALRQGLADWEKNYE